MLVRIQFERLPLYQNSLLWCVCVFVWELRYYRNINGWGWSKTGSGLAVKSLREPGFGSQSGTWVVKGTSSQ